MLDSETAERRQQLFGDLEKEKEKLNAEVENLRSFEREYRSRLKSYFQQQLSALDGSGEGGILAGGDHAPSGSSPCSATRTTTRAADPSSTALTARRTRPVSPPGAPASCSSVAQARVTEKVSPRSSSRTTPRRARARSRLRHGSPSRISVASTSSATSAACSRSASAVSPSACQQQRDPVADVEAAGLAGLLHQPDHLAGQAGPHQLRGQLEVEGDGLALLVDHRPALARPLGDDHLVGRAPRRPRRRP